MDRDTFYRRTAAFIAGLAPDGEAAPIAVAPDENLFDTGLLTSFSVIEVMTYLESLTGRTIDPAGFDIEMFSSLERLWAIVAGPRDTALTA